MIKYFHKLSIEEFDELVKSGMTWGECAEKYPQPEWCGYPQAVLGDFGCWSLMSFKIKNRRNCMLCEHYIKVNKR